MAHHDSCACGFLSSGPRGGPDPPALPGTVLRGYAVRDIPGELEPPRPADPKAAILRIGEPTLGGEGVATCLMATHMAPFVPSGKSSEFTGISWQHRVGCEKLAFNHVMMREMRSYAYHLVRRLFSKPLPRVLDFEEWLSTRVNYNPRRKDQLRRAFQAHEGDWRRCAADPKSAVNKVHVKREGYMAPKYARIISSRSDTFKTLVGPLMHRVEEVVFSDPHFIKHVPNDDRPGYIQDFFRGVEFVGSNDFSSFESLIYGVLMDSCECELYRWLLRDQDQGVVRYMNETLCGIQEQTMRGGWRARLYGRQSGDMCTSVGNGWTNLVIMSYVGHKLGWHKWGDPIHGLFEGDDSIFKVGSCPEQVGPLLTALGMRAKFVSGVNIGTMGFLSTWWCNDLVPVRDFRKPLVFVPWILQVVPNQKQWGEFLRAKGLSLAYEMAGCPVLSAFARMILRGTAGLKARYLRQDAWWDRVILGKDYGLSSVSDSVLHRLQAPIPLERRVFYARQFACPVETQLYLEKLFDDASEMKIPYDPVVAALMDPGFMRHCLRFTSRRPRDSQPVFETISSTGFQNA